MRTLAAVLLLIAACGGSDSGQFSGQKTYEFGPYTIQPNQEVTSDCIQISLDNEEYANVNVVELTTGPGFHHSNWFYVPDFQFPGPDGTWDCDSRGFDQAVAAVKGGVFFAQSTQTPHEIQRFPEGVVIRIPPKHKLVAQIHLLNPSDAPLNLKPNVKVTFVKDEDATTRLAGLSLQNQALALPPNMNSKFTIECDVGTPHQEKLQRAPDFKIYYALAHYHELGTGIVLEAVKPTGEATTIYTTATAVGDTLGGPIAPAFDFTGYTKIRFSCTFYNPRANVVGWGVGDQEMCVFLAFTDSTYNFGGGINSEEPPQNPQMVGNTMTYQNTCEALFATDNDHG